MNSVLRRAVFATGESNAAATVIIYSLEANLSPPVQREGTLSQSGNARVSSSSNHEHHKASTHFAGRCV